MCCQPQDITFAVVPPASQGGIAPVVEYRAPVVVAGESLVVARHLAEFLAVVNHEGAFAHHRACHKEGENLGWIGGKLFRAETHLVVVLKEVQHRVADSVYALPAFGQFRRRHVVAFDPDEGVV